MKQTVLEWDDAISAGLSLPWALIREMSSVSLGPTPGSVNGDELLEACFFSETEEIRIWRESGTLRAARIDDEPDDRAFLISYRIENPKLGRTLAVKRYIAFDGDGQAFVRETRLCGWKGAGAHE